jgi:hypothetical protein
VSHLSTELIAKEVMEYKAQQRAAAAAQLANSNLPRPKET